MKTLLRATLALLALPMLALGSSSAAAQFAGCDPDQVDYITAGLLALGPRLAEAEQDIQSIRDGGDTSRFEYWFGPVSDDRIDYIESLLEAVYAGAIANASYHCGETFGCRGPNVLAWTEHGSALSDGPTYGVYICEPFYGESLDLQAGTLVHEFSHLYGTRDFLDEEIVDDDWKTVAHQLAQNNPGAALVVAYNFQFYVMD